MSTIRHSRLMHWKGLKRGVMGAGELYGAALTKEEPTLKRATKGVEARMAGAGDLKYGQAQQARCDMGSKSE